MMLRRANDLWDEFTTGKSKRKEQLNHAINKKISSMVNNKIVANLNSASMKV
jgi:hypothetical protein